MVLAQGAPSGNIGQSSSRCYFYPNPVSEQLTLHTPAPATFRLLNEFGKTVYEGQAVAGVTQHSLAALPAGAYVLELQLSGQPAVRQKLLKTH